MNKNQKLTLGLLPLLFPNNIRPLFFLTNLHVMRLHVKFILDAVGGSQETACFVYLHEAGHPTDKLCS